jgi:GGDEF domain-containing protein
VYSRRWWFELAGMEFSRWQRYESGFSLMAIDLDFFKRVNDTCGHEAGDRLLCRFADMLRAECRHSDIVGRVGGEEFTVLAPETSREAAETIAERISAEVPAPCRGRSGRRRAVHLQHWYQRSRVRAIRTSTPCCGARTPRCTTPSEAAATAGRATRPRRTRTRERLITSATDRRQSMGAAARRGRGRLEGDTPINAPLRQASWTRRRAGPMPAESRSGFPAKLRFRTAARSLSLTLTGTEPFRYATSRAAVPRRDVKRPRQCEKWRNSSLHDVGAFGRGV